MGRIILARAATTDFDEQDRIVGTLDIPLNVRGQSEITSMAEALKGQPIVTIYAAASEAAKESAQLLGERLGVKVRVLKDLKNLDFGLWQGLPVEEVRRKHPKLFKQWEESPCTICPPAGEMVEQVFSRIPKSLKPVLKRRPNSVVVLFAPDPLRQVIRCYLTGVDVARIWETQEEPAWRVIEWDGEPANQEDH